MLEKAAQSSRQAAEHLGGVYLKAMNLYFSLASWTQALSSSVRKLIILGARRAFRNSGMDLSPRPPLEKGVVMECQFFRWRPLEASPFQTNLRVLHFGKHCAGDAARSHVVDMHWRVDLASTTRPGKLRPEAFQPASLARVCSSRCTWSLTRILESVIIVPRYLKGKCCAPGCRFIGLYV